VKIHREKQLSCINPLSACKHHWHTASKWVGKGCDKTCNNPESLQRRMHFQVQACSQLSTGNPNSLTRCRVSALILAAMLRTVTCLTRNERHLRRLMSAAASGAYAFACLRESIRSVILLLNCCFMRGLFYRRGDHVYIQNVHAAVVASRSTVCEPLSERTASHSRFICRMTGASIDNSRPPPIRRDPSPLSTLL
jgi:hypothetical protein